MHIAPSTYYDTKSRHPSKRAIRDASIIGEIERVHKDNYGVYGIRKVHAELAREGGVDGVPVARCAVARLMREVGLRGITRAKTPLTRRSNITDVLEAVCGVSLDAATTLICVDEIHNLNLGTRHGAEASDTLKYFAERIPATFVYAGIDVEPRRAAQRSPGRADRRTILHDPHRGVRAR